MARFRPFGRLFALYARIIRHSISLKQKKRPDDSSSPKPRESHLSEDRIATLLLKEKARLLEQIGLFTDIQKNPQVKLTHLVMSALLLPFLSLHSLLSLDRVRATQ